VSAVRILGIVLLALGLLAVAYGGFGYRTHEEAARIGPVKIEVEREKRVNVPLWAGVASAVAGVVVRTTSRRGRPRLGPA
jgi:hypothetical protein